MTHGDDEEKTVVVEGSDVEVDVVMAIEDVDINNVASEAECVYVVKQSWTKCAPYRVCQAWERIMDKGMH
jgi:hypothetical protein